MNTVTISAKPTAGRTTDTVKQIVFGFVLIYLIYFSSAFLLLKFDQTIAALIRTLLTLTAMFCVEKFILKGNPGVLGFGWPGMRAVTATVLAGIPFLAFYPIFTAMTGTAFVLPPNWLWTYLGYIAVSGITEEVMFRAYLFGHLRARYSFWGAATISMFFFSLVHLLLFFRVSPVIAIASILLAIVSSFPLAYLYEHSRGSIWAVALLHSLVHTISVVTVPDGSFMAPLAFMAVTAVSPWIVFLFGKRYFSQGE